MRSSPGSPTPVARRSTPASRLSSVPPAASATPSASALPFSSTLVALTSTRPASLDDSRFHTIGRSAEQERPVPAPTDGFCWFTGSAPPRGVLFAYTAVSHKGLRAKWLSHRAKSSRRTTDAREGDVVKAIRRAHEIRGEIPQAVFTLVLACTVDPPEDLVTAVKARCLEANVEADFWAVSRLAHFLD